MKRIFFFIGTIASWILTSCSAVLYTPTSQMTPTHEKKGDIELNGAYGLQGAEANASVAVTDHLAVAAQGRVGTKEGDPLHQLTGGRYNGKRSDRLSYGAALSYFQSTKQEDWYWNVATGFVTGKSQSIYTKNGLDGPSGSYDISSVNTQVYVQPALAYHLDYIDAIFSCRTGWVGIQDIQTTSTEFPEKKLDFWVAQPAATVRVGPKNVKASFQFAYTLANKKRYDDISTFWGGRIGTSVGLQASF